MIMGALQIEFGVVETGAREGVGMMVANMREGAEGTITVEEMIAGMARRVCTTGDGVCDEIFPMNWDDCAVRERYTLLVHTS
jgi:hypothetical protein